MASELLEGSCLCGQCRYAISANLMHFFHCHCLQCRKTTSSSFAANIIAEPAEIQWVSGADNIKRFDYPGRGFTRVFCTTCGSGLPFLDESGSMLFVPTGTLDNVPSIQPEANIFWDERAEWTECGFTAPRQSGFDGEQDNQ